jgi:threonine aldolase
MPRSTPPPRARQAQARPASRPPVSRDAELERLAASCTRFLVAHGPRTAQDLLATIPSSTKVDYYGVGGAVATLEQRVATLLGKPAALFLPTGTMAQQAVLRVHADRRTTRSFAFHPTCHLDGWAEERGYERLHGLFGIPVGPQSSPLAIDALEGVHQPLAALLLEVPQRALGGTLPTWQELTAQVRWAKRRGAAVHLDGARLWEAAPYYASAHRKSLTDVAALFDSIYVSFYKGLGGIAGCCVAGDRDLVDELSVWRTRHGGRIFMMWPYAASALSVLDLRLSKMPSYF